MSYRLFRLGFLIRRDGIIDDTAVSEIIPDILWHHEGVTELTVLHIRRTGENRIRIIVVFVYQRITTRIIIVPGRDGLHLIIDSDIHFTVEIRHQVKILIDNLSLYMLHAQRVERIHLRQRLYLIVGRVVEAQSRIA